MTWTRAFGPTKCGSCGAAIGAGELHALVGPPARPLRRCRRCAPSISGEPAPEDPQSDLPYAPRWKEDGPRRLQDVVTTGQLAQRNDRRAAAIARARRRRATGLRPPLGVPDTKRGSESAP